MENRTFTVTGMTCGHCTGKVEKFVGKLEGVTAVTTDLASGKVVVTGDFDSNLVKSTIEKLGYQVQ
jgi:copper ion binding protein